jgi:hypothetical protein
LANLTSSPELVIATIRTSRPYEYLLKVSVALNLALAFVLAKSMTSPFYSELRLKYWINSLLQTHPHDARGDTIALFTTAFGLAVCIFLLLEIFSLVPRIRQVTLYWVSGLVATITMPSVIFYVIHVTGQPPARIWPGMWSVIEVGLIIVVLLSFARKIVPVWFFMGLVVLHFGFWSWEFSGTILPGHPVVLALALVGLCLAIAWARFFTQSSALID